MVGRQDYERQDGKENSRKKIKTYGRQQRGRARDMRVTKAYRTFFVTKIGIDLICFFSKYV